MDERDALDREAARLLLRFRPEHSASQRGGRYAATLFPVFMLLGASTSRRTHETLLIVGSLGLALLAALFVTLHKVY